MIIQTSSGKVKGVQLKDTYVFRGIPYAAPPVSELRFKPPVPPLSWEGIRECDSFGPIAHQRHDPNTFLPELMHSEDCLNLNVWTPGTQGSPRPVIVYIHGGGFIGGKGAECDGARYATEDDFVYVSINYRLGALGFLYLGELLGEEYSTSGNNGMLDIFAALRWVQTNITAFGGDPHRVTVIGNSAGAKCTATLYTMKEAEGLFHRAIAQSGATQSIRDIHTAGVTTTRLLEALDLQPSEVGKLLSVPAELLIEAQMKVGPDTSRNLHMFGPVADGILIPVDPLASIQEAANLPPLLIGTNEDEAAMFILYDPGLQKPDPGTIERLFGQNQLIVWESFIQYSQIMPIDKAWSKILTEHLYTIGCLQLADAIADTGSPVWVYRLQYGGSLGAAHGYEGSLIHYMKNPEREIKVDTTDPYYVADEGRELAQSMRAAWNAFIREGDPNAALLPEWPVYGDSHSMMVLDLVSAAKEDPSPPNGVACSHQVWRAEG
ncbi:carboxylesterase family protein [Paenibacillus lupini]|uniref:carboxylesterase family protein n=1 Tax=Paenibacillus lupini TaxID=1450204 RepID=UPI001421C5FB|nr:para-nitrobenzyl esterase [Paenibacillus lupini]